jgi:hypothetical protein
MRKKMNKASKRKIDWEKARKIVSPPKEGIWYEDYDEAEGIFMGWRKCKNNMPVTQREFLEFYDKCLKEEKMARKKPVKKPTTQTKSKAGSIYRFLNCLVDDHQRKIEDIKKEKWKDNKDTLKETLKDIVPGGLEKIISKPLTLIEPKHPTSHCDNIWLSRNSGRLSVVELWTEKPKRHTQKWKIKNKEGKKEKVICYYVLKNSIEIPAIWISASLAGMIFGLIPEEGELIGPFRIDTSLIL